MKALSVLSKYFGYESFRDSQEEIINTITNGRDCLVLMPTGGGKSVCYQVPALLLEGLTIVISPLIALMKDQVDALRLNGVNAAFLNSSLEKDEQALLMKELQEGKIKLLYIAPERLNTGINNFIDFLQDVNVSLFAIDEAHCISHWGHDFRPDYLTLSVLKEKFPGVPVIALTATADSMTRKDIVEKLRLKDHAVFISSFNRPNIRYMVEDKADHFSRVIDFLNEHENQSGIIYCLSRNNTEEYAEKLREKGIKAQSYHAGLDARIRTQRQEQFKRDEVQVIVATTAFGMGIDKSNVRFVIHSSIPKNVEGYYQETGRAGRDGLPAQALLFYSGGDVLKLKNFLTMENNNAQTRIQMKKLDQMSDFCVSNICRRKFLLNYFDEEFNEPCGNCDICLDNNRMPEFDGTIIAQKSLSAVIRLKEKFGIGYLINFLKGSESQKIYDEHKLLPTFGKGKEFSIEQWRNYFRQLIDKGYLRQHGEYSVLKITDRGRDVLFNSERVMLIDLKQKKIAKAERKKRYAESDEGDYNHELFDLLRKLRLEISLREGVPPYVVFADTTLVDLSSFFPFEMDDLRHISGFGKVKISRYGEQFLSVVKQFCEEKKISSKMSEKPTYSYTSENTSAKSTVKNKKAASKPDTKSVSLEMYQKGMQISEIAVARNLAEGTISDHLLNFIISGQINVLKFVTKEKLDAILKAIDIHGDLKLNLLKEQLGETYSFNEIKAAVNYKRRENVLVPDANNINR